MGWVGLSHKHWLLQLLNPTQSEVLVSLVGQNTGGRVATPLFLHAWVSTPRFSWRQCKAHPWPFWPVSLTDVRPASCNWHGEVRICTGNQWLEPCAVGSREAGWGITGKSPEVLVVCLGTLGWGGHEFVAWRGQDTTLAARLEVWRWSLWESEGLARSGQHPVHFLQAGGGSGYQEGIAYEIQKSPHWHSKDLVPWSSINCSCCGVTVMYFLLRDRLNSIHHWGTRQCGCCQPCGRARPASLLPHVVSTASRWASQRASGALAQSQSPPCHLCPRHA
jgi:hypothetical protein